MKPGRKRSPALWCLCACVVKRAGNVCNGSAASGHGHPELTAWAGAAASEPVSPPSWYEAAEGAERPGLRCGRTAGEASFNKASFSEKCVMLLVFPQNIVSKTMYFACLALGGAHLLIPLRR